MVSAQKIFWVVCLLGIFQGVATAEEYIPDRYDSDGDRYWIPRPYKKSPVTHVTIMENGMKSEAGKGMPDDCTKFKVTEKDIKEYFAKAKVVSNGAYMHEINWSPCYAGGEIKFANGKSGKWGVQQLRAGYLLMDGKEYYFDCQRCRSKVYDGVLVH